MASKFVKHIPCDECGSSDANSLYDDGHTTCYACDAQTQPIKIIINKGEVEIYPLPTTNHPLKDRGISVETTKKFQVTGIEDETNHVKHVYPYFDAAGQHIANKLRLREGKSFLCEGEFGRATLFGQQIFPPASAQAITLVEGECDALAAFELLGSKYPVVSVHGVSSATKNVARSFEYLNSFDKIVICFDADKPQVTESGKTKYPGQEAAVAVASMFPIGKVRVLTLKEFKDANDYLLAGKHREFVSEWWKAPTFTPAGLRLGKDMWEEIKEPKNYETVLYPWDSLNKLTYGIRLSELVLVTSKTGVGKTSILREIEHYLLNHTKHGIGLLHLEESNSETALGIMSVEASKPLHLPDVRESVSPTELKTYFDKTCNTERIVIWDHFGSNSVLEVLAKIRHMHNLGCKYIVLDHLSIIVSDQSGDERKQLDEIATKLKMLCMELNISVIACIHMNRMGMIRSSAGPEQLANIVLKLERDLENADEKIRNTTKVMVVKNRFCGRTGPGCYLYYDDNYGRISELAMLEIEQFEKALGNSPEDKDAW
jgi:twinkle protein